MDVSLFIILLVRFGQHDLIALAQALLLPRRHFSPASARGASTDVPDPDGCRCAARSATAQVLHSVKTPMLSAPRTLT
ncbi:hypothetical protein BC828DRAFT_391583 [Blastocladiella britannica]|nr:hypothetical protein BC828DRAFT_391583 [Blastocladiella britannica]